MKTRIIASTLLFALLNCDAIENRHWTPEATVDSSRIEQAITQLQQTAPEALRQPVILAYRAALFLAASPEQGTSGAQIEQITAQFDGEQPPFKKAIMTVQFMGYADDSLHGEKFTLTLVPAADGTWQIPQVIRSAYGRGDHR